MKILHITTDEKFINSAAWQFERVSQVKSTFLILVDNIREPLKHVKNLKNTLIQEKSEETHSFILKLLLKYDLICFHGLDYFRSKIILNSPAEVKLVWFIWGIEIYGNPLITKEKELLGDRTYSHFYKTNVFERLKTLSKNFLRPFYYRLRHNSLDPHTSIKRAMERVDLCGILYQEEHDFVRKNIRLKSQFFKFCYYPIEFIFPDSAEETVSGNNILLGNSATESNNHLDIFDLLNRLDIGTRNIVVPLSYGDKVYGMEVLEIGKKMFPYNLHPLVEFMPLNDYNQTIRQCGIVIMGHYRQQAVGNVLAMIWMGAKVYLDERNSLYHYLKRIGISVFSIEKELVPKNLKIFNKLTRDEIIQNRKFLKAEIGEENLLNCLRFQLGQIA